MYLILFILFVLDFMGSFMSEFVYRDNPSVRALYSIENIIALLGIAVCWYLYKNHS